jgi:hypothetical protein
MDQIALFLGIVVCVYWSRAMAIKRGRAQKPWMWLAASFGPLALPVLALLPKKS